MPHLFFHHTTFSMAFLSALLLITSCHGKHPQQAEDNGAFRKERKVEGVNVQRIVDSGELIVATMSGPDTYFEYQDKGFGLQYALACNFAEELGVAVRVEVCTDTLQMVRMLQKGDVDLIGMQMPEHYAVDDKLESAGASVTAKGRERTSWMVKTDMTDLAEALDEWFADGVEVKVEKLEQKRQKMRLEVRRKVRAPFISKEKGIISTYDQYFKEAAAAVGWDWKLIAAQCYQESGFDPNARSWAGASGLMQLMPGTAAHLGLPQESIFRPAENVAAAARYLAQLQQQYRDVADPEERAKFVLAAYNAGPGHVNDAQALARKHGRNAHSWDEVSHFIRCLSQPQYYRDPVVRHGYMIGQETYNYVLSIMDRWAQYGGGSISGRGTVTPAHPSAPGGSASEQRMHKRNRFSKEQRILSPDELGGQASQPASK